MNSNLAKRDPCISFRRSMKWGDGPVEEPTSTLVLTSSFSHFVDIRVLLPEGFEGDKRLFSSQDARIEWAFCGSSESRTASADSPSWGRWTHWLDSLYPSGHTDEGLMWEQGDGSVVEKGSMAHLKTGVVTPYEEVWKDDEAGGAEQFCHIIDKEGEKGMFIQVGDWVQGLLVFEDMKSKNPAAKRVIGERWHREGGTWKILVRFGEGDEVLLKVGPDGKLIARGQDEEQ